MTGSERLPAPRARRNTTGLGSIVPLPQGYRMSAPRQCIDVYVSAVNWRHHQRTGLTPTR